MVDKIKLRTVIVLLALAGLLVFAPQGEPQTTEGQINGTITDPTGSALPSATIEVTDLGTARRHATTSTSAGTYALAGLPAGNYQLTARAPGFKRYLVDTISVLTGTTTTVDVQMQIGETSEDITVSTTATPLIQTSSPEVSTGVEQRMVLDLPLQLGGPSGADASGRRQIENFIFLTAGVTGNQWSKSFNGSTDFAQESIIDGLPHPFAETPGFIARTSPPFEAVQEFKVSSTLYPAEYGRGLGVVNYTLKSGTNSYHGDLFYLLRNDVFDARGFFPPTKAPTKQNNYGFNGGGPIRKNKTFFYFAYERYHLRGAPAFEGLVTLPTAPMRQGDFSQLLPSGIQLYDPATTTAAADGGFTRQPFAGNQIPASRISGVASRLNGLIPAPDLANRIVNNFISRTTSPGDDRVASWKIDHRFSEKHSLSYSTWWAWQTKGNIGAFGVGSPLDSGWEVVPSGGGVRLNYDWIISPSLLNHFSGGLSANYNKREAGNLAGNEILQIPGIPSNIKAMPSFSVAGLPAIGNGSNVPLYWNNRVLLFADSLSWVRGRHQLKFGGEFWDQYYNDFEEEGELGTLGFSNLETSLPNSSHAGTLGYAYASFLLGQVDSASRVINPPHVRYDMRYAAFFAQDSIRVTRKLTLNLGLRYELPWPARETTGRMSAVDLGLANPDAGGRLGAYVFGTDKVRPGLDKKDWGPRAGLAYSINDKTVVRLGYGLVYAQTNATSVGNYQFGNLFFSGWTGYQSIQSLNNGVTPALLLDQGYPAYNVSLPALKPGIQNGAVADYMPPDAGRQAYTQNWQVDIQRELPRNFFADISYVGNKGSRLPSSLFNINQVPSQYLSLGSLLSEPVNSAQAVAAGIPMPYPGFIGPVSQALRPYPQYTNIVPWSEPIGNSTYHALQLKVQKRYSGGLSLLGSYTFSKTLTDTGLAGWAALDPTALDSARLYLEKSLAPNDVTHNVTVSLIYELPFARTQNSAAKKLAGGWEVGWIERYQSGTPLSITGGPPLPLYNGGNRPDPVVGVDERTSASYGSFDPARDRYLNADVWVSPAAYSFGTGPRIQPNLRGFPLWDEDLSAIKRVRISRLGEQFAVEFRAEIFNLFNRVQFANPATNINNPQSFGTVSSQANLPRNVQFMLKVGF